MTPKSDWTEELDALEQDTEGEFPARPELGVDVADGGYLSWLYGSSELRHQAWPPKFIGVKPIIVMDSRGPLNRELRNPGYKAGREDKRQNDQGWKDRTAMVQNFREVVEEEDGRFKFVRIEGLEADDLVALAAWYRHHTFHRSKSLAVMGIDKDFLQLGRLIELTDKDGYLVDYWRFQRRLPKFLQDPLLTAGWQVLLTLCLMGDKSDSIPRILEPRTPGLSFLQRLYMLPQREAFEQAFDSYGKAFLMNLYDVILPDPAVLGMDPGDVFDAVLEQRWNAGLYTHIKPKIRKEVLSWNLSTSRRSRRPSPKSLTPSSDDDFADAFDA